MNRIQRKRTKGWKMPANTVYVGRPSKWGNPFKVGDFSAYALKLGEDRGLSREEAIGMFEEVVRKTLLADPHFLDELKGKDLACFCPIDKPCHADVLLKFLEEKS
jgi:hypothetical protein